MDDTLTKVPDKYSVGPAKLMKPTEIDPDNIFSSGRKTPKCIKFYIYKE